MTDEDLDPSATIFAVDGFTVGVGPHPEPWPTGGHYDEALLRDGDRRNVIDQYRYWKIEAIVADLDLRRHSVHVAIENWEHDFNIGTVIRNANAFGAAGVHIVGRKRWNRRGAMVTDRYQHLYHHKTIDDLLQFGSANNLEIVGIDNTEGSHPIETVDLPRDAMLVFGQEGPGLSIGVQEACSIVCSITMYGSTRSINAGVASGIALHSWVRQHVFQQWTHE